jgi:ABC-type antimicrobial peptide transport system permease subunit
MAIGACRADIARGVTAGIFAMVMLGAATGMALGMASVRYIETLFYGVKATDTQALALPSLTIVAVALVAALPAVVRALRIDPAGMLRAE